jgi:hypothetical protein
VSVVVPPCRGLTVMNALRGERQLGKKTHINAIMQEQAHDYARSLARFTAGRMVGRCAMRPGSARGVHVTSV